MIQLKNAYLSSIIPLSDDIIKISVTDYNSNTPNAVNVKDLSINILSSYNQYKDLSASASPSNILIVNGDSDNVVRKVEGKSGEVVYRTGDDISGYINQRILQDNWLVCENEADVYKCKQANMDIDFSEIFNNWQEFGNFISNDIKYQYPLCGDSYIGGDRSGINKWELNGNNIIQPVNTTDFCGYLSDYKFTNYVTTIKFSSKDDDDDVIGFVAAAVKDSNGYIHTLSFIRSPNKEVVDLSSNHWYCALDCTDPFNTQFSTYVISSELTRDNEFNGNWNATHGVKVKIQKYNNKFSAKTTKFTNKLNEPESEEFDDEISFDLSELVNNTNISEDIRNILQLFIDEPIAFGFCTFSQEQSTFDVESFVIPFTEDIINITDKYIEQFNYSTNEYEQTQIDDDKIKNILKDGTFLYNKHTKKYFYINGENAININLINADNSKYNLTTFSNLVESFATLLNNLGVSDNNIIR